MLHIGSIAIGAFLLFCSVCAPATGIEEAKEPIYYQDTATAYSDMIMPCAMNSVSITYSSKSLVDSYLLAFRYPKYTYSPALGACGSVAGGNAVGFYDRYDENLIPNHTSGTAIGNIFSYSVEDSAVREVITQLYNYMGADTVGTTKDEFINGITNFCKDKKRNVSFSSCMKSGSFSYSTAQTYLKSNQPIILFLSGYNVGAILEYENKDTHSYYVSEANHIMVGFGYSIYNYTTSSGTVTYNFLEVASGISGNANGLYNISYLTKINDALAINIY